MSSVRHSLYVIGTFGSADFTQWGSLPVGLLFGLMLVRGCAGSISGAIKIFRWQILFTSIHQHLEHMLLPHKVHVAQAIANAGPGLTQDIGPAGNFTNVPDLAKWTLSAAMLLGRLELATVYVLFLRLYWSD